MLRFILLLLFIGTISARHHFKPAREFEVKQTHLLNNGRSYTITEVGQIPSGDDPHRYTIKNEVFSWGKKLILLDHEQPIYEFKHKLGHIYQEWHVYDAKTGDTVAEFKHHASIIHDSYKVKSSRFGEFTIKGEIGSRTFSIKRDGHKVAKIHKKYLHLHDTYNVEIEDKQDPAIILIMTIGIDEVRQH